MVVRYRGFISYTRSDFRAARRLHMALESYRVPRDVMISSLVKKRKIGRFFHDVAEMEAEPDIGAALRGALQETENLIVVCSPDAAKARWVNDEIVYFRGTQGANRVFAVIVKGRPNSDDPAVE